MVRSRMYRTGAILAPAVVALTVLGASLGLHAQKPKFFSDDPLQREPETQDASKVQEWEIGLTPDLLQNLFSQPGDATPDVRAQNINTIDEVPDSSWFTNRIYSRPVAPEELAQGAQHHGRSRPGTLGRDSRKGRGRGARLHGPRRKGQRLVPELRRA